MKYYLSLTGLVLSSCGVYKSQFDCPPGKGIGCAPVSEVLDMIVEEEHEEDDFVTDVGTALILKQENHKASFPAKKTKKLCLVKDSSGVLTVVEDLE